MVHDDLDQIDAGDMVMALAAWKRRWDSGTDIADDLPEAGVPADLMQPTVQQLSTQLAELLARYGVPGQPHDLGRAAGVGFLDGVLFGIDLVRVASGRETIR